MHNLIHTADISGQSVDIKILWAVGIQRLNGKSDNWIFLWAIESDCDFSQGVIWLQRVTNIRKMGNISRGMNDMSEC